MKICPYVFMYMYIYTNGQESREVVYTAFSQQFACLVPCPRVGDRAAVWGKHKSNCGRWLSLMHIVSLWLLGSVGAFFSWVSSNSHLLQFCSYFTKIFIGVKNLRNFLIQSEVHVEQKQFWLALTQFPNAHWLVHWIISWFVISQSNYIHYFGLGFTPLNWKLLCLCNIDHWTRKITTDMLTIF